MCIFYFFSFSAYIRFFDKILIETNVNISIALNISVVYRSVNCFGSQAKFSRTLLGFIDFARDPV